LPLEARPSTTLDFVQTNPSNETIKEAARRIHSIEVLSATFVPFVIAFSCCPSVE